MSVDREVYDRWVKDYLEPRYPELVPQLQKARKAFDMALENGVLTHDQLASIVESARSSRTPLGENAAAWLGELSVQFTAAAQAVREMAAHAKVHVRVNALVAISSASASELHDEVIRIALKDRSSRVRTLAADKIMLFGLRHLLADLEQAIQDEIDGKTKDQLQRERDLLRDGYHLQWYEDGRAWMTCRLRGGGGTMGSFVSAQDLTDKGAKQVAKTLGGDVN